MSYKQVMTSPNFTALFLVVILLPTIVPSLWHLSFPDPNLESSMFLGRPAQLAGFDPGLTVRRVATLCPDFPNPLGVNGVWCLGQAPAGTFYSSFIDPNPIPNIDPRHDNLEHGFYSLTVKTAGASPSPQVCKVNAPDCGVHFAWEKANGQVQAHVRGDSRLIAASNGSTVYYAFGTKVLERNPNYYTGSWYNPPQLSAGMHVKVGGRLIENYNPNTHLRFLIITGLTNVHTGNTYELDINIGRYGIKNPVPGYDGPSHDALSVTDKYAMVRPSGKFKEIYIGAAAWGLPILDLKTGAYTTYDIDFTSIWQQMVQDGVIDAADLQPWSLDDPNMPRDPILRDWNFWSLDVGISMEDFGEARTDLLVKELTMYSFAVGTTASTSSASSSTTISTVSTTFASSASTVTSTVTSGSTSILTSTVPITTTSVVTSTVPTTSTPAPVVSTMQTTQTTSIILVSTQTATQTVTQTSATETTIQPTSHTTHTTTLTSTATSTTAQAATSSSSSSSTSTPIASSPIPGFPWESIMVGIVLAMCTLAIVGRRRRQR